MNEIRVSLIEDDSPLREQVAQLIDATPGLRVVSQHANGVHAMRYLPPARPHVALVDIHLPLLGGIECVRQIKGVLPDLLPIMFTQYGEEDLIYESLKAGAVGFLIKGQPPTDIARVIQEVCEGGSPMTPAVARRVARFFHGRNPNRHDGLLTPREEEILRLIRGARSNKEIASELQITPRTVANHLQHIYRKLHIQSRAQAMNL